MSRLDSTYLPSSPLPPLASPLVSYDFENYRVTITDSWYKPDPQIGAHAEFGCLCLEYQFSVGTYTSPPRVEGPKVWAGRRLNPAALQENLMYADLSPHFEPYFRPRRHQAIHITTLTPLLGKFHDVAMCEVSNRHVWQ
jgi:hypothetical protein